MPAQVIVEKHIEPKYACRSCEGAESEEEGGAVKIAAPPLQLLPKTIAAEGTLAYITVSKFCDHIPFYRLEKIFSRYGIELSRQTFFRWMIMLA